MGLDDDSRLTSSELAVVKAFISKEFKPDEHCVLGDVCSLLYPCKQCRPTSSLLLLQLLVPVVQHAKRHFPHSLAFPDGLSSIDNTQA